MAGFANVAEKAGLEIATAKRVEAQGGSILCTLVRKGDRNEDALHDIRCDTENDPNKIANFERNYFSRGDIFANFMKRTERKLKNS